MRTVAILMITGAVLANVAFVGLGAAFEYPDILQSPTEHIMQSFQAREAEIVFWFGMLALSAALLAPIAIGVGRLGRGGLMRIAVSIGIAAALVQVIGLSRWLLFVPSVVEGGDVATFELLHRILGVLIGETLGYLFTGLWTIMSLASIGVLTARWFRWLGYLASVLIISGVLMPLDVPGVDFANFVGYVLWSAWLIVFGVILWRIDSPRLPNLAS